jgi:filamentous hemagglutinin family protein
MKTKHWLFSWRLVFVGLLTSLGVSSFICKAIANTPSNIQPDSTLGRESSQVIENFQGRPIEVIRGGATRGINLFHSFREFNVSEGRGAYFFSPNASIQNILAWVTGSNRSEILGRLGTSGESRANLFLMNPNGIIFGANSSLDVGGSFAATTANAIAFGERGNFSATNPETPGLLTVNPSVLFFDAVAKQGEIVSQSNTESGGRLFASPGKSLLLVGGNIILDDTQLGVRGGRIEIGSISSGGSVELIPTANRGFKLGFSDITPRSDVLVRNNTQIYAIADGDFGGGDIAVYARNLDISGSSQINGGIFAGIGSNIENQAGDIKLNTTGILRLEEESQIKNTVNAGGFGNSGNINIQAGSLFLSDNSKLITTTFGQGNGGNIQIEAVDRVSLDSGADIFAETRGTGNGGNININTNSFSATNRAAISNSIHAKGNTGDIVINANDSIYLGKDVRINNEVWQDGDGIGGNINFNIGSLFMADAANINAFSVGNGKSGDIIINANDLVSLDTNSRINKIVLNNNAGNLRISTKTFSAKNNALIEVDTFGKGNAGNVQIEARDNIYLDNAGILNAAKSSTGNAGNIFLIAGNQFLLTNRAFLSNEARENSSGAGGSININTGSLTLNNLGIIQTFTEGKGNAGNIIISARDRIVIRDGIKDEKRSSIASGLTSTATANAGNIEITTDSLELTNRALITNTSDGKGNPGDILFNANNIWFDDASAYTRINKEAFGSSGNIEVNTETLHLTNGAQLDTSTFGRGNSGNLTVNASDTIFLDGTVLDPTTPEGARSSTLFTEVYAGAVGNGGDITINTGSLIMTNAGQIDAKTRGTGDAGNIFITASDRIVLDGARPNEELVTRIINSVQSDGTGKGGNIEITTGSLSLTGGAQILSNTAGQGSAGSITIKASDRVSFDGTTPNGRYISGAFGDVVQNAVGNGGDINITAESLDISGKQLIYGKRILKCLLAGNLCLRY